MEQKDSASSPPKKRSCSVLDTDSEGDSSNEDDMNQDDNGDS